MAAARSCEDQRLAALKPICDGKSFFQETLRFLGAGSLSRGTVLDRARYPRAANEFREIRKCCAEDVGFTVPKHPRSRLNISNK
jgi:hypothetical protein